MIICTGCGKKNDDENRYCDSCGKKLQSSHHNPFSDTSPSWRVDRFEHKGVPPETRFSLARMIEAWAYVLVLGGVAAGCLIYETWWPLYPAVGLLGLAIWLRRI